MAFAATTRHHQTVTKIADFVLRHRRLVLLSWLVILLAGGFAASRTASRLTFDFSLPGQPGYETAKQILGTYGNGGAMDPDIPVITLPAGQTVDDQRAGIAKAFAAINEQVPGVRVADYSTTGDRAFVTADGRSTFAMVFPPPVTGFADLIGPKVQAAVQANAPAGSTVTVTGFTQLSAGNSGQSNDGPGVLLETLLGAVGALAVLVFVFASFLAIIPMIVALVSILTTFLLVFGLTYVADISFIVQFLVSLIGLGVSIDYSLLIVSRWREERSRGRSNEDAVRVAVETAGHSVLFSGVTVAVGLAALIVLPVPFLRSMGYGGMLIPLVATAVSLTMLPAILAGVGSRLDWPHVRKERAISRGWAAWGRLVVRHRWVAAGVAVLILAALLVPFTRIKIGVAQSSSLASAGPAYEGLHALTDHGVGTGVITPIEILVRGGDPAAVAAKAREVPGIVTATAPAGPTWQRAGSAVVLAIPSSETVAGSSTDVVKRVRSALADVPGVVGEAGIGALQLDYLKAVYGNFPLQLAIIVALTFVLLMRAFRSVVLPLKAVLLNLLSVSAVFGAMVFFWQEGHGSGALFGVAPTGAITFWLPILVFAFLFGLSMDYEVFILARIREEYDATGSTTRAVVEGLGRTGRLVTSAALILFLSFVSLAASPGTDIKVFATGLGVGILLDATVVRALLVPALVSILGDANWWLPRRAASVLRVAPSGVVPEQPAARELLEPTGATRG
jgi:RND superfamily putative drug exporter